MNQNLPHQLASFDHTAFENPFDAPTQPSMAVGPRKRESYWRRMGGGSLGLSILLHVVFIAIALFLVKFVVEKAPEEAPSFNIGGGSNSQGANQNQSNKRRAVSMNSPVSRVVSINASAITIPDVPTSSSVTSLSKMSLTSGGMGNGNGLRNGTGLGNGLGDGMGDGSGPGNMKGYLSTTIFGSTGGRDGLKGSLYDMKQAPDKQTLDYDPSVQAYATIINDAARTHFSPASLRRYYKAAATMNFNFLAVPRLAAAEGPKAFGVENEIKPRGWFVHYSGTVTPPDQGPWRFVGFFDDCLMVFVNSRPVLDGSWDKMIFKKDDGIREPFGGADAAEGGRKNYAGKWFTLKAGDRLDIIVGERPGGLVGGMLLIEKKGEKYDMNPDGSPILPLFATKELTAEERARMDAFSQSAFPYPLAAKIPVFTCAPIKTGL